MDRGEGFQLGRKIWNWDPMVRFRESGFFSNFKARQEVHGESFNLKDADGKRAPDYKDRYQKIKTGS